MVQRHEYAIELGAPPDQVWEVFWYRAPDRPQPKDVKTRIEILYPGDDDGNGLVRHCYFPVPRWLLSGGVGQSWEWLTEVKPFESWRYDAIGKPLWSRATGRTKLTDLGAGRTRVTFIEEYEAFNPVMRALFEKRVHSSLSRDNDTILAALEGGLRWHRKRRARAAGD
ncbi:MAG TPA: polyketide cyclase / dehydrase and lipid transport family protein [Acidimicrobiia bacterium]|nr:polyketide cyclase / dehydrase and lipid transport family protein [Acidimicrobiia bacterium]